MTDEILENLANTLYKPIEKERVVYIMVEIRKYLEGAKNTALEWKDLKYWCDWTVHTHLDRKFANNTLKIMEDYIKNNPNAKFNHSYFNKKFVSLEGLRFQLYEFLKFNQLSTEITNISPWKDFTKYLVETLRDCPLEKSSGLVRKFFFSKRPHISEAERYSIDWELIFDGTKPNLYGSVLRYDMGKDIN